MKSRDPRGWGSMAVFVLALSLVVSICVMGMAATALAGNNPSAKVAVHVRPHSAKAGCTTAFDPAAATCADLITAEPGFSVDAFPVFFNLTEYKACEYSLSWPAWTYAAAFNNCADFVIGEITLPGEGASHTWSLCQAGMCVPSYLWLYADGPGQICPAGHPEHGFIYVLDCEDALDTPIAEFCAGVYGATGDDPCAEDEPECQVGPVAIDFGTVTVGENLDAMFTIENIGGGFLEGEVTEACDYYQIISGGGAYSLGAAETREVTVRFSPLVAGDFPCVVETGTLCQNVACTGAAEAIPVYVDIRPGQCPNKLRVDGPFSIPVAILGTADFSVIDIDPNTVGLTREGTAATVSPQSWNFTDVGTPFMGSLCDCHTLGMDGLQDLGFRFRISDVSSMLDLGTLAGSEIPLTVTGNLTTGEEIEGSDCVLVISGLFGEDIFADDIGIITHSGFSPKAATIRFSYYTRESGHIVFEIFDVQGRNVATLVDEVKASGIHEISWQSRTGSPIPAGVYFARITNGETSNTEKIMVVR